MTFFFKAFIKHTWYLKPVGPHHFFCFQSQKKGQNPQFLQSRNLKCIALCEGSCLTLLPLHRFTSSSVILKKKKRLIFSLLYNSYYISWPAQAWWHLGSSKYRSCLHTFFLCVSTFKSISVAKCVSVKTLSLYLPNWQSEHRNQHIWWVCY